MFIDLLSNYRDWFNNEQLLCEWVMNTIICELFTSLSKLRETTWNDVSNEILDYKRLNNEFLIMDFIILIIDHVYATFRKALTWEMIIL